jgi:DNA polymerase III alpha subunit
VKLNQFNEVIVNEQDILKSLYSGQLHSFSRLNIEDTELIQQFNTNVAANADSIDKMIEYIEPTCSVEEFDLRNQQQWFFPEEYKTFDIAGWLLAQCTSDEQIARVVEELELFVQHGMVDVLVCVKYLVDYMRKHDIVWGLGRGSSVASYCLYLIGIHKVDSIRYQLDIKEFLKGE